MSVSRESVFSTSGTSSEQDSEERYVCVEVYGQQYFINVKNVTIVTKSKMESLIEQERIRVESRQRYEERLRQQELMADMRKPFSGY